VSEFRREVWFGVKKLALWDEPKGVLKKTSICLAVLTQTASVTNRWTDGQNCHRICLTPAAAFCMRCGGAAAAVARGKQANDAMHCI